MCVKKNLTRHQVIAYRKRVLTEADAKGAAIAARMFGIHRDTIYVSTSPFSEHPVSLVETGSVSCRAHL